MSKHKQLQWLAATILPLAVPGVFAQQATVLPEVEVLGTAEQAWKQAPGVSTVTQEDLSQLPTNDLSDVLRKQPGVNLTGNSTSGQRGNNRQIDLRGMGPENTLILIDGKPVNSRKSVRFGWRGERGPAAARYGNGAAGGVVNIVTKGTPNKFGASATLYYGKRQHKEEGGERRASFSLAGPISDMLGFRLTGNIAKTDSDAWDINRGHASTRTGTFAGTFPAGREGVRNRDLDARLSLRPNTMHRIDLDASFSRQGNIYTGDTQNTNNFTTLPNGQLAPTSQRVRDAIGSETNRMYRTNYALTHTGRYEGGASSTAYLQYEATRNTRMDEGLAGGTEGLFSDGTFTTAKLDTTTLHGEYNQPGKWGELDHVMTVGAEVVNQKFTDRNSVSQTTTEGGTIAGLSGTGRSPKIDAKIYSVFVEDNIELTPETILTPGVRFDHHSKAGNNWSPSLNLSHNLTREIALKAGVARAYKAQPQGRDQHQQGTGHRAGQRHPRGRPDLLPQRLPRQDRGRPLRHRQGNRRHRPYRQRQHLPVGQRAQGAGHGSGRHVQLQLHAAGCLDQQPHLHDQEREQVHGRAALDHSEVHGEFAPGMEGHRRGQRLRHRHLLRPAKGQQAGLPGAARAG